MKCRRMLSALGLIVVVAACDDDRSSVFTPIGDPSYDFTVSAAPAALATGTSGALDLEVIRTLERSIEVDTTVDSTVTPFDTSVTFTTLVRPSGNTEDTLAVDSAAVLTIAGLRALGAGNVYQAWHHDATGVGVATPVFGRVVEYFTFDTGNTDPLTGDPIFAVDSTEVAAGGAGTYTGSDDPSVFGVAFQLNPQDAASTISPFSAHALVVSVENGAATAPSAAQFLWRRTGLGIGTGAAPSIVTSDTASSSTNTDLATPDTIVVTERERETLDGSGGMTFGTYGGPDVLSLVSPNDYVYPIIGVGRAGVRGDEVSVDFQRIARPPRGFFYVGYLIDEAGGATLVDTLRSGFSAIASESRASLFNADADNLLPQIAGVGIESSQVRNCRAGSGVRDCPSGGAAALALPADGPFAAFRRFVLVLEPKGGASIAGPNVVYSGDIPEIVFAQ